MAIATINTENFELTTKAGPVLIEFSAPWCVYCRRLTAVVDKLAAAYEGKLPVGQINIDDSPALAERFSVDTIPTFVLFRDGKAGPPLVNPGSKADIEAWLAPQGAL